jgi:hypothetical protein
VLRLHSYRNATHSQAQLLETVDRDAESAEGTDHEGTRSTPAPTGVGQRQGVPDESYT